MVKARAVSLGAVVLLLSLLGPAQAGWEVTSHEERPAATGVEYRRYSLGETLSGAHTEIHLALFSTRKATLRVIDQPESAGELSDAMTRNNAIAGVNGGYFDPEGAPVGLLRSGGRTIAKFQRARLLSGVLAVGAEGPQLFRANQFPQKREWREALQCGPFLIDQGKVVAGLNASRSARRTFVATLPDRRAAIGYCAPVTLAELAEVLAAISDLKFTRALNLDGGSSSAFWCLTNNGTVSLREQKNVRDFLGVVPLPSR